MPNMAVIQMEAPRAKNLRREIQLFVPAVDGWPSEKTLRPDIHFARHCVGHFQEPVVAVNRELEVSLVFERHRRYLAERILAVEHPPVGSRQQRVRHVSNAFVERRVWLRGRTSPLNPLPFEV